MKKKDYDDEIHLNTHKNIIEKEFKDYLSTLINFQHFPIINNLVLIN